jgi:hypothetical protein
MSFSNLAISARIPHHGLARARAGVDCWVIEDLELNAPATPGYLSKQGENIHAECHHRNDVASRWRERF